MILKEQKRFAVTLLAAMLVLCGINVAHGQGIAGTTLTVSGTEQNSGGTYDTGTIGITINGHAKTFTYAVGHYAMTASVASHIAAHISMDTSEPVWAKATGNVITIVPRVPGVPVVINSAVETPTSGVPTSFTFSSGTTTVTPTLELSCNHSTIGAWTSGTVPGPYESADCIANITGISSIEGAAHAPVNPIVFTINSSAWTTSPVTGAGEATAAGFSNSSAGTYTITATYSATSPNTDSYYPAMSASRTIVVASSDPGHTPGSGGVALIYNYSITGSGGSGYDPAGNIIAYADSVQGQWTLGYDVLNRLAAASSSPAIKSGTPYLCWSYDSFGNRKQQYFGASAFSGGGPSACSGGGSTVATQDQGYSSNNQLQSDSTISTSFGYDASGNLTSDGSGTHQYAYDAEGRVCAMSVGISPIYYWGYLYDAEGHRVAKGSISSLDCSLVNGDSFAVTESYIIGPDGSTMTALDGSGTWKHTDVPAGPGTMAVYDSSGLHFRFTDWLGSHRVQTDYKGTTTPVEDTYQSLPFGELLGSAAGATEKHFTGKEHDDESGLDYFGARYYGSNMGRFISPDWSAKVEPVPYSVLTDPQSLNLYSYVRNHPISAVDADGHQTGPVPEAEPESESESKPDLDEPSLEGFIKFLRDRETTPRYRSAPPVSPQIAAIQNLLYNDPVSKELEKLENEKFPLPPLKRGGENEAAKLGRQAHEEFTEKAKAKGWQTGVRLTDPKTGKTVIPDAITKSGHPVELKPRTDSGRTAGRRQLAAQQRAANKNGRVIYHDQKP